jgi:hypothetical protein
MSHALASGNRAMMSSRIATDSGIARSPASHRQTVERDPSAANVERRRTRCAAMGVGR